MSSSSGKLQEWLKGGAREPERAGECSDRLSETICALQHGLLSDVFGRTALMTALTSFTSKDLPVIARDVKLVAPNLPRSGGLHAIAGAVRLSGLVSRSLG
jgi:hypothetical protein